MGGIIKAAPYGCGFFTVGLTQAQMRSLISVLELKVGIREADNASAVLEKVIAARSQK